MSKSAIAWLLIALGGIGVAVFLIKMVIIGYYPNELVPFVILGVISAALLWLGGRFRKAAALESGSSSQNGPGR
ncbi:hypothetical protein [Microbacterium sediminis]|uniref:hypothetical protein n=1 Tax=Microbacterium sediminis TaxID=904291 RepID=UPI0010727825|nr:hypothetical protein [Microbacterium sediminis]QBR73257.1 hypothetical protein E3O41_01585 [Microbacterium sediminis]